MTEVRANPDGLMGLGLLGATHRRRQGPGNARQAELSEGPLPVLGIWKVAVVMLNDTGDPSVDELEFAQIFSTELERLGGAEVSGAAAVEAVVCHNQLLIPREVDVLGRLVNVDAVVVGYVREYDACNGPKVSVAVEVHAMRRRGQPTDGRPDGGPGPLVTVERTYDGEQRTVKTQVEAFAARRESGEEASSEHCARVMPSYLQFVSDRVVRELLEELN